MTESRFWNLIAKKLAGDALPEELVELEELMKSHPELLFSAEHVQNLWKSEDDKADYESELAFELHLNKLKQAKLGFPDVESPVTFPEIKEVEDESKPKRRLALMAFSVLFIISAMGFTWYLFNNNDPAKGDQNNYSEVSSSPGSKTKLVLPDSTIVWLNAGSKLTYSENFGLQNRNTTLTGEAYFDVKKGTIPFIIHTNGLKIKVLGTAFNVKSYPDEMTTETSLLRGKLEVSIDQRPEQKFVLNPNEKLVISNKPEAIKEKAVTNKEPLFLLKHLSFASDSTIIETAWTENKLVFQDESFYEVAKKMERWYGVKIKFAENDLAYARLYGSFTRETIAEALDALKIGLAFDYKIEGEEITITNQIKR